MFEADDRTRTDNLLITNQLLCQLSHIGLLDIVFARNYSDLSTDVLRFEDNFSSNRSLRDLLQ